MALMVPATFRDYWGRDWSEDYLRNSSSLLDQDFGLGLTRDDLLNNLAFPSFHGYFRPWRNIVGQTNGRGMTKVQQDKDKYQIIIDVQHFAPNEITVKTADNSIIVEGKHDEKRDEHGYVSRQFRRRYDLPKGHDIDNIKSKLSSDGVLTITAPKLALPASAEKIIPIKHTSAPAVKNA